MSLSHHNFVTVVNLGGKGISMVLNWHSAEMGYQAAVLGFMLMVGHGSMPLLDVSNKWDCMIRM